MQLLFDPNIAYECVQCGKGCFNQWDILVEPEVVKKIKGHPLELRVIQERGGAFVKDEEGSIFIHKNDEHPRCGFLREDMLCSVHAELGYAEKPLTCQQYPYLMTQTPDGVVHVSAAYSCTAVKEEIGPALEQSRPNVEDLLKRGGRVHKLPDEIEVLADITASYADIHEFEKELTLANLEDAVAGLANALKEHDPQPLKTAWQRAPQVDRSQLRLIQSFLSMGLLKPCLPGKDKDHWRNIDQAMLEPNTILELPDFDWSAPLSELDLWVTTGVGNKFNPQIERYQKSLVFRKAHLTMGGLLPGLMLLWVKPLVLRMLTGLCAWKQQQEPDLTNFLWALERTETCLVGHTFDTVPVYRQAALQAVACA